MQLARQLAVFSRALQEIGADLYVEAFRNAGIAALSIGQYRYLEIIHREPGITATQLAERMRVRKPTVTAVLQALEDRGLVTRTRDASDARVRGIRSTVTARGIFAHRNRMYSRMAARIRGALTPSRLAQLDDLFRELIQKL
jgi:DNA-binding MarR family transcriptional regulator